jgi:hypothetical protein
MLFSTIADREILANHSQNASDTITLFFQNKSSFARYKISLPVSMITI